jgi:hypothetical protein
MVIEVVTWEGASKTHAIRQDHPTRTLCGRRIPDGAERFAAYDDHFPTCAYCARAIMLS